MRVSRRIFLQVVGGVGLAATALPPAIRAVQGPPSTASTGPSHLVAHDLIGDLADSLDYDVERIFRFVRQEVRYEPYVGVLRGARGTLASRAGNSVDQALLVASLLEASALRFRFAMAAIDDAGAASMFPAGGEDIEEIRRHTTDAMFADVTGTTGVDPEILRVGREAEAAGPAAIDVLHQDLMRDVNLLTGALAAAGVDVASGFTAIPDRERNQHVWVQLDSGTDWLDLDPAATDLPGEALTTPDHTATALPDDLTHRVELSIVAERVEHGSLVEETLLVVSDDAHLLAGQPVQWLNVRPEGLAAVGVQVGAALTGMVDRMPVLRVGDAAFVGRPFHFGVEATDGESPLDRPYPEGETTALWLETSLLSPDREPVRARRALFDRVGTVARVAGSFDPATLDHAEAFQPDPDADPEFLAPLGSVWLSIGVGLPGTHDPERTLHPDDPASPSAVPAALHLLRQAGFDDLALPMGVRPYLDAPNVNALWMQARGTPEGPVADLALDLIHRSFGLAPVASIGPVAPPGMVAGVLAHVAERLMLGPGARAIDSVGSSAVTVSGLFERAQAEGHGVRVLTGPSLPTDFGYPPEASQLLADSLRDGWVAVTPERPVVIDGRPRAGWWLVDPRTGRTVDQLDDGRQAGEYQATLTVAQSVRLVIAKFGCVVGGAAVITAYFAFNELEEAVAAKDAWRARTIGMGSAASGLGGAAGIVACLAL